MPPARLPSGAGLGQTVCPGQRVNRAERSPGHRALVRVLLPPHVVRCRCQAPLSGTGRGQPHRYREARWARSANGSRLRRLSVSGARPSVAPESLVRLGRDAVSRICRRHDLATGTYRRTARAGPVRNRTADNRREGHDAEHVRAEQADLRLDIDDTPTRPLKRLVPAATRQASPTSTARQCQRSLESDGADTGCAQNVVENPRRPYRRAGGAHGWRRSLSGLARAGHPGLASWR